MTNYKNAKIYKLVSKHTDEVYYGSTCMNMTERLKSHKKHYYVYEKKKCPYHASFEILKHESIIASIVEHYPCNNSKELKQRLEEIISQEDCVNKLKVDYEYSDEEKQIFNKYKKQYRRKNKDKIKQYNSQNLTCECGSQVILQNLARHKRTKKHQEYVNSLS